MKIYTKTGDNGETGLLGGLRVKKNDAVIIAVGDVDETNSLLGLVISHDSNGRFNDLLQQIQKDLFVIGGQIANCRSDKTSKVAISDDCIKRLESEIDSADSMLPPLTAFILPGGCNAGAQLHVSRSVCRRAERSVIDLIGDGQTTGDLSKVAIYLNRLSDLLFVLARAVNAEAGQLETQWLP